MCRGSRGEAPSRRRQGGLGDKPPAAQSFCIFYLKIVNFSAFNRIICSNSVLYIMHCTDTKYSDILRKLACCMLELKYR